MDTVVDFSVHTSLCSISSGEDNASCGKTTYVHCKAGRGRSTTIVLCYLVQHRQMTPNAAYAYVRQSRPRVLLASSQWQAVQEYYRMRMKKTGRLSSLDNNPVVKPQPLVAFDDSPFVVVSESDLDGYESYHGHLGYTSSSRIWAELRVVYRFQLTPHTALARLSCFWIQYHKKLGMKGGSIGSAQLAS